MKTDRKGELLGPPRKYRYSSRHNFIRPLNWVTTEMLDTKYFQLMSRPTYGSR